jgi:hypothetical protein
MLVSILSCLYFEVKEICLQSGEENLAGYAVSLSDRFTSTKKPGSCPAFTFGAFRDTTATKICGAFRDTPRRNVLHSTPSFRRGNCNLSM